MGNAGSRTTSLAATLNVGVEYQFPLYRRLSFGLLSNTRFMDKSTDTEMRVSADLRPVDIISASANIVAGTYRVGLGWIFNLNLKKGFNLFVGMYSTPGKLSKQFAPLNSNMSFYFGIDFPLLTPLSTDA